MEEKSIRVGIDIMNGSAITAVNTVSRLREGKKLQYIEKCKAVFVSIISTIQGAYPFFNKDNFLIAYTKKRLLRKKIEEIDRRKEKYLSILDSITEA